MMSLHGGELLLLHLGGHLTPNAGQTEGGAPTVGAEVPFDAVALTQRHPDGHRDGTDAAEHVQQGETETLTELLGGSTGEAGAAPEGEAALLLVVAAVADP